MSAVAVATGVYRTLFEEREQRRPDPDPPWLPVRRREALARFEELGFPGRKTEAWKYTSAARLARGGFGPAPVDGTPDSALVAATSFGDRFDGHRVVVVNGRFSPGLSSLAPGDGVVLGGLAEALRQHPDRIEPHLGQVLSAEALPFTDLNTALFDDGACLIVEPGRAVERPIQFLFLSVADGQPVMSHPRALVLLGRGSQATLVEAWAGAGEYWTNAVTEVVLEDGAVLDHYKLQQEGVAGQHVASLAASLARDSRFADLSISLGGALARNDVGARLAGPGAECRLDGLFVAGGSQHMDTHSRIDHASPHTTSRQLYKGILGGSSRGVFHGRVVVRQDAQKTDAEQSNRNLLLSRGALVDSTPQLEILADDVKCKHGSTTGQIDPVALFYLRSRGIGEAEARRMLSWAFASELVERIRVEALREALAARLRERLPEGSGGEA